ncbi:hypothetical protein DXN04_04610 [Chitinophaga silvisoli]|uniref:Uncharacterized protein n=2 Tax=Chitinophaga silvisoli TaxID=2291814 RepID=A0A3E1P9B5_9BACT|nr:hypothetical protein DXN04_04610 [Chitinophaga silvisoli]
MPGIIIAILGLISCFFVYPNESFYDFVRRDAFSIPFIILTLKWSIAYSWEHIIRKDYRKVLFTVLPFIVLNLKIKVFTNQMSSFLPPFIDTVMINIIWTCVQIIGLCYIAGKKNYRQIGLVAGLMIYYTTDAPANPLNYFRFETFRITDIIADLFLPFLIYGWIYLAENYFNEKDYKNILNSKIQVISGQEYRFLYALVAFSCWVIIYESAAFMKALTNPYDGFSSHVILTRVIHFVMEVSIFYITASLTRNIVISRMNTIANHNGWLYFLHYIPVLNIIVWMIFSQKPQVHTTKSENAAFYLAKHEGGINNFIIILGVLFAIWNLYGAYQYNNYRPSAATAVLLLLMFAKLINYFFLDKGKSAIISLVVLGCLGACTQILALSVSERSVFVSTMAGVLSYFFLVEIFHPELDETDRTQLDETGIAGSDETNPPEIPEAIIL